MVRIRTTQHLTFSARLILEVADLVAGIFNLSEDFLDLLNHEATKIRKLAKQYVSASIMECGGIGTWRDFVPLGIQPRRLPLVTDEDDPPCACNSSLSP
jgi:hypothetical protein